MKNSFDLSVIDHWNNMPLLLDDNEIQILADNISVLFNNNARFCSRLTGGHSGADILCFKCANDTLVARVTSVNRALRENYVMKNFRNAANSLLFDGETILMLPPIRRHFTVAVTITKFVMGIRPSCVESSIQTINSNYSFLFEATTLNFCESKNKSLTLHFCKKSIDKADIALSHYNDLKNRTIRLLTDQVQYKNTEWIIAHGDPSLNNVILSTKGIVAVDYAVGGIMPRLAQKARWLNSIDHTRLLNQTLDTEPQVSVFILADLVRRMYAERDSKLKREIIIDKLVAANGYFRRHKCII